MFVQLSERDSHEAEPLGRAVVQWFDENFVDDRGDRCGWSDSHREYEKNGGSETPFVCETPNRLPETRNEAFHSEPSLTRGAGVVANTVDVSELAPGGAACVAHRHAARDVSLGRAI